MATVSGMNDCFFRVFFLKKKKLILELIFMFPFLLNFSALLAKETLHLPRKMLNKKFSVF
jgi:hypothetical protein